MSGLRPGASCTLWPSMWHKTHAARIQQKKAGLSPLRSNLNPELAGRSMPAAYALRVAWDVVVVGL